MSDLTVAKLELPPAHPTDRAMWHLELGYQPGDEYVGDEAPLAYCIFPTSVDFDDDWYDEDDDLGCTWCGGEGWAQVDDPLWDDCDEFGYGDCPACNGTGQRRHQWVF